MNILTRKKFIPIKILDCFINQTDLGFTIIPYLTSIRWRVFYLQIKFGVYNLMMAFRMECQWYHFGPMLPFYTPWKHPKLKGFWYFHGVLNVNTGQKWVIIGKTPAKVNTRNTRRVCKIFSKLHRPTSLMSFWCPFFNFDHVLKIVLVFPFLC